jgi:hypothetical protein
MEVALQPRRLLYVGISPKGSSNSGYGVSEVWFSTHYGPRRRTSARPGGLLGAGLSRNGAAPLDADEAKPPPKWEPEGRLPPINSAPQLPLYQ